MESRNSFGVEWDGAAIVEAGLFISWPDDEGLLLLQAAQLCEYVLCCGKKKNAARTESDRLTGSLGSTACDKSEEVGRWSGSARAAVVLL